MVPIQSRAPLTVSFSNNVTRAADHPIASSSSSPLVPSSSSPSRSGQVVPLGSARTVLLSRRAVIFSPSNHTKYFHSDDSIIQSNSTPPQPNPVQRVYPASDPVTPHDSPSLGSQLSDTSSGVRSILKSHAHQIRVAASVEEGTLNNREAARLLVCGKRPGLVARDSFDLAMLSNAAAEGTPSRKGKGRMPGEVPSSDENAPSAGSASSDQQMKGGAEEDTSSEEEEEEMEQDGALATGSLIDIILNGAENLLTLEEAYNTLALRLRQRIPTGSYSDSLPPDAMDNIRVTTQPIRDEAPAMVRAIQRDIHRLLGKFPSSETVTCGLISSSPFKELRPLPDLDPRDRFTPSPTPQPSNGGGGSRSPNNTPRQGYTESEIRYRREASGVGAAVLRLLAFIFHSHHLYTCFSSADLQSLLDQVLAVTRTPRLPTPNPKKTYFLSVIVLTHMRLPDECIAPIKDKLVRGALRAVTDDFRTKSGGPEKQGPSGIKKEGFHAVANLFNTYPIIFFPFYPELLPGCLRGLHNSTGATKYSAAAALGAFVRAKQAFIKDALVRSPRESWPPAKAIVTKSEFFVVSHMKSSIPSAGAAMVVYSKGGERRTEWTAIESVLKDGVGSQGDVHWACGVWATLVTMMGAAYPSSGLTAVVDNIMDRSLRTTINTTRPLLARIAWNHGIHAYLSAGMTISLLDDDRVIRSYNPFAATSSSDAVFDTILIPFKAAIDETNKAGSVEKAFRTLAKGGGIRGYWKRSEKPKRLQWAVTCSQLSTAILYAYTGAAIFHEDPPAKARTALSGLPSSDGPSTVELTRDEKILPRIDSLLRNVLQPIVRSLFAVRGVDRMVTQAWGILEAITTPDYDRQASWWSLDSLISTGYLGGEAFEADKEADISSLITHFEMNELKTADIPSWGKFCVSRRIRWLLGFFDEALTSVKQLNSDQAVKWVTDDAGNPIIPVPLSNLWSNLLGSLEALKPVAEEPALPYFAALAMVTNKLLEIVARPGPPCLPMCFFDENNQCAINEDRVKIALVSHLFGVANDVLGENTLGAVLGVCRLGTDNQQLGLNAYQSTAFDVNDGHLATPVGLVLGVLLRTSVLKAPQDRETQKAFMTLVRKVVDVGLASEPGYWKMFLGDITKSSPFLMMDCEEINLGLWRMIATKWIERITLDGSAAPTNTTGDLLVSLLSDPFRSARVDSPWYHLATEDDLEIWSELLRITMERFRLKRVGVNFGLLETMAAHMTDHLEQGDRTISATITLRCLASAASCITFSPSARGNHSPWHAHENYVPVDFLTLVNKALETSYSSAQSQAIASEGASTEEKPPVMGNVSPGVIHLLESLGEVLQKAPGEFVGTVLGEVESGLLQWLVDAGEMATEQMKERLDKLQGVLLKTLAEAVTAHQLPVDYDLIAKGIDVFTSRDASFEAQTDFIAFADGILEQTYGQTGSDILDAVKKLLVPLGKVCEEMPLNKVSEVLLPVPGGIALWLKDHRRILPEDMIEVFNSFYLLLLSMLAESISPNHIPADSNSVNALLDIYASRASYMVRAFCEFWSVTFGGVEGLEYSEDVKAFLRDMVEVQPGMIDAPGLSIGTQSSHELDSQSQSQCQSQAEVETKTRAESPAQPRNGAQTRSQSRSQSLPQTAAPPTQAQDVTEIEMDDELLAMTSIEYDADASQSQSQLQTYETQPQPASPADFVPLEALSSGDAKEDVFGPAAMTKTRGRKKGRGKKVATTARVGRKGKRALASVEQEAEAPATKRQRTNSSSRSPDGSIDEPILVHASEDDDDDRVVLESLPEQAARKESVPSPAVEVELVVAEAAPADDVVVAEAGTESIESTDVDEPKQAAAGYVSPCPPPTQQTASSSQQKGSLLVSAGRWLSRVPTFSIFSPASQSQQQSPAVVAEPVQAPATTGTTKVAASVPDSYGAGSLAESEASTDSAGPKAGKKLRKKKTISAPKETGKRPRSSGSSILSVGSEGKRKTVPVVELVSRSPNDSSRASSIASFASGSEGKAAVTRDKGKGKPAGHTVKTVVVDDEEEEEDELLLSPESAMRGKQEEEREINNMVAHVEETQLWNESVSGRFDDAPDEPSPFRASPAPRRGRAVAAVNPSPARRTAQQSRILSVLEEAAKGRDAIASLDHEGMKDLMRSLNLLRDAAENRLVSRVDEMRRR